MNIFNINYLKAKIADHLFKYDSFSKNNNNSIFHLSKYRNTKLINNENKITNQLSISIVTYNSKKWLSKFFESLNNSGIDFLNTEILICDNGSTDGTIEEFNRILKNLKFKKILIQQFGNIGFGAGHNKNIFLASSPYVLITNVDIEFEPNSIALILEKASLSVDQIVSWEFRQIPYEHPKYYDPVTQLTNWNSHACVLLRTNAVKQIGGYDENIFMYGEDVDLSYHLRSKGFLLSYYPDAVVTHNTYESAGQIKPIQYSGSTFANWYLRIKYGNLADILAIPKLYFILLRNPEPYVNAHKDIRHNFKKLIRLFIKTILSRKLKVKNIFSFYEFDYEFIRDGAFYEIQKPIKTGPLVSIITRTYKGREEFLKQCINSVKNQTYKNIEHIIVEDGGNTYENLLSNKSNSLNTNYFSMPKVGRCVTGNLGLSKANGDYLLFLDDDDLIFADHIEILLSEILKNKDVVAVYTPSLEVKTEYSTKPYTETSINKPEGLKQNFDFEKLNHSNYITIQSILFQKNLFETRGGFNEEIDVLEDWNLWHRYAYLNKFKYIEKTTSLYRVPADVIANEKRSALFANQYEIVRDINNTFLLSYKNSTPIYK